MRQHENAITRRSFLASTVGAGLAAQSRKPNVLFIGVDDWRDWVGCLGTHPLVKTPNLDRLARRGVLFTNAHCSAPVCNASRTAIMTGMNPSTSGVYANSQWWRPAWPDVVTLPAWFKQNGYHVAGGGKMFHHEPGFNDPGAWHEYFYWDEQIKKDGWGGGYNSPMDVEPPRFPMAGANDHRKNFDFAPIDRPDADFPDYKVASWASDFLRRKHDMPFFLGAGMFRPHISWYVPRSYFDLYPLDNIEVPKTLQGDLDDIPKAALRLKQVVIPHEHRTIVQKGKWKAAIQAYLASITFSDAMVGRVLDALEVGPNKSDTIIVLWSDHGYHLGEKEAWHKFTLWEESTRVPLIFSVPGITRAGTRSQRPAGLIDLYPTLLDLCGLPKNPHLDGQSLRPLLSNPAAAWGRPALTTASRGDHTVRDERWRYIRYADGSEELYDHRSDPKEWRNLASEPRHRAVKLRLARWLPKTDHPGVPQKTEYQFHPATHTWTKRAR